MAYADHKVTNGPVHDWDCPPCVARSHEAEDQRAAVTNPHRAGTKVHARFERERYQGLRACDPRTETYWCM
jgi:hypothetical protein